MFRAIAARLNRDIGPRCLSGRADPDAGAFSGLSPARCLGLSRRIAGLRRCLPVGAIEPGTGTRGPGSGKTLSIDLGKCLFCPDCKPGLPARRRYLYQRSATGGPTAARIFWSDRTMSTF